MTENKTKQSQSSIVLQMSNIRISGCSVGAQNKAKSDSPKKCQLQRRGVIASVIALEGESLIPNKYEDRGYLGKAIIWVVVVVEHQAF